MRTFDVMTDDEMMMTMMMGSFSAQNAAETTETETTVRHILQHNKLHSRDTEREREQVT